MFQSPSGIWNTKSRFEQGSFHRFVIWTRANCGGYCRHGTYLQCFREFRPFGISILPVPDDQGLHDRAFHSCTSVTAGRAISSGLCDPRNGVASIRNVCQFRPASPLRPMAHRESRSGQRRMVWKTVNCLPEDMCVYSLWLTHLPWVYFQK